jgi:hypothetical protein
MATPSGRAEQPQRIQVDTPFGPPAAGWERHLPQQGSVLPVRRVLSDWLVSIVALSVLIGVLVAFNDGVRQQVAKQVTSGQVVTEVATDVQDFANSAVRSARAQAIKYAPLVIFVAAAGVLVVFMLRV